MGDIGGHWKHMRIWGMGGKWGQWDKGIMGGMGL